MRHPVFSEYWHKAQRIIFGDLDLEEIAQKSLVIHSAHEFEHPNALYFPEELERITGTGLGASIAGEIRRMQAHRYVHQPTLAYELTNLLLCNGDIYGKRYKYGIQRTQKEWFNIQPAITIEQPVVISQTWLGAKFFGHAIFDHIPLNYLAQQLGTAHGINLALTEQLNAYHTLFNTQLQRLPNKAVLKKVTLLDDFHYNEHKVARWQSMRDLFKSQKTTPAHKGVFLMRGNTGTSRLLVNEVEIKTYLQSQGFICINPGESTLDQVIEAVANTNIVIGVEGSQLAHGLLGINTGGTMLVLQPPMQFSASYKYRCDVLNIRFAFHICQVCEGGFKADLTVIKKLMELL